MEIKSYEHGVPSWVDLGTADLARAVAFYGTLFGWDVPDAPEAGAGYRWAMLKGRKVAGFGPQVDPGAPYWATYISVESAADVAASVVDNGGRTIVSPRDVLDLGHVAVLADPQGAVFSIWQPGLHKGAALANEPGAFSWNELLTTDAVAATTFYSTVFGWEPETHGETGSPGSYTEWKVGGRAIAGMMATPPNMASGPAARWAVYFSVADTDAAVALVADLGGNLVMGPMDIEPGRFAVVADPAGAVFNVIAIQGALVG